MEPQYLVAPQGLAQYLPLTLMVRVLPACTASREITLILRVPIPTATELIWVDWSYGGTSSTAPLVLAILVSGCFSPSTLMAQALPRCILSPGTATALDRAA